MVRHLPGNPVNRERHAVAAKRFEGTSTARWTPHFQICSYLSDKAVGTCLLDASELFGSVVALFQIGVNGARRDRNASKMCQPTRASAQDASVAGTQSGRSTGRKSQPVPASAQNLLAGVAGNS